MDVPKSHPMVARCEGLGFRAADDLGDRWHFVWSPRDRHLVGRHVS
jgi:hypothetical protein